jgi:hypothetical protein
VKVIETLVSLSAVPTMLVGGPGTVIADTPDEVADVLVAFAAVIVNEYVVLGFKLASTIEVAG